MKRALAYAQRRADETRSAYVVSSTGHAMVAVPQNLALVRDELGGVRAVMRPRRRARA